uniref:Uncharacterized protein n=1 Tax=Arundo donax TaxID=35708 RepID=A0A0A9ESI2_ARUDO
MLQSKTQDSGINIKVIGHIELIKQEYITQHIIIILALVVWYQSYTTYIHLAGSCRDGRRNKEEGSY